MSRTDRKLLEIEFYFLSFQLSTIWFLKIQKFQQPIGFSLGFMHPHVKSYQNYLYHCTEIIIFKFIT